MRVGHHVRRGGPGLAEDALALGFGISAKSAQRTRRLLSCLLGVGPDLVTLALELGKTLIKLHLGRSGPLEQLAGLRPYRIRLIDGKLQNGPHPLTQSVSAGGRRGQTLHLRFQLVGTPYRRRQTGRELLVILQQALAVNHEPVHMSLQRGQCLINLCRSVAPAHDRKAVPASGAPVRFRRHAATVVRTGARAERRDASIPTCSCHCGKRCRYTAPAIDSARPNRAPAAATRSRDRPPPAARSSLPARSANDTTGYAQVLAWILDHAPEPRLIVSIEGTRSYGIGLAQTRIRIDDPKNRPCDSSPHTAQASREGVAGGAFGAGDVNRHALLTHQGMYRARIASAAITPRVAGQSIDTALWGAHAVTAENHAVPQEFFCDPPPEPSDSRRPARTRRTPHPGGRRRPQRHGHRRQPLRRRLHRPRPHDHRRRPRRLARVHLRRPRRGRTDPLSHYRRCQPDPLARLWHAVPCLPSISEVWLRLLEAYRG